MAGPDQHAGSDQSGRSWLFLSALLPALLLLPTLLYPFGRDQAVFAYVGSVMSRGGVPYRDAWDLKPPGIYLAYSLLASLVGDHGFGLMRLLRAADLVVAAGVGVLLARILCRLGRPEAGVAAAGWYASLYMQGGYWGLAQAESWANLFLLGGGLLALEARRSAAPRLLFWAGVLGGLTAVLKFTAVLPLLPFLGYCAWHFSPSARLRAAAVAAVGLLLPLAGAVVWLVGTGALPAYLEIQRGFVAPYTQLTASGPLPHLLRVGRYTGLWLGAIWLPAILVVAGIVASPTGRRAIAYGLTLLGGGLVAVWIQDKYFGYHWQTVLPAVALLAALGTVQLCRLGRLSARATRAVGLALVLLWAAGTQGSYYRDALRITSGHLTYPDWLLRFGRPGRGDNSFLADTWVAEYVRGHSRPGDPVLIWGFEPAVYLLSDRRPATRFFFNVPVSSPFVPVGWRQEYLHDLTTHPPELFLCVRNDAVPWASGRAEDSRAQLESWPELREWVERHYRQEQQIEDFTIYRRVPR